MKDKRYFCPVCKTEMSEKNNELMVCSKCGLKISKANLIDIVYCRLCNKLFANTHSYNDHLLVCEKENKGMIVR